jgi:beta-galactosidase
MFDFLASIMPMENRSPSPRPRQTWQASPPGEGANFAALGGVVSHRTFRRPQNILPLPLGEGRGEGARLIQSCLIALLACCAVVPLRAAVPIPAESEYVVSLNGNWRFKLEQALPLPRIQGAGGRPIPIDYPTNIEPFYLTDYREDKAWHDLGVPGNWEMAGFSPATYDQPDNASGLYRLTFDVPAKWAGRQVKLNFDGVQNGCEIWCNGQPVAVDEASWGRTNYHEGGWTAWQADLTPAVKFGQANLLALRVVKNTKSVDCDSGDFFFLGGVHRPVTLFSVPASCLGDVAFRSELQGNDAQVTLIAKLNPSMAGAKVAMELEGQPRVEGEPDANGEAKLTQLVRGPKLWSAEFPNLYALSVELLGPDGKVIEGVTRKVGIREVTTKDGVFCVNGVPVKLVGICRHDVYPTLGTAINADVWRKDLTLMKAANFNAVRTSHYPYGSGFYDLCDQMGFYVLDEEPFCWVNCDDPEMTPAFAQRARETVQRDKNHPCVVIWGIGNENKPGRDNTLAAKITREIDPTRPRLVSCQRAEDGGADVEFDDAHYVTPESIHKAENDPRRAKIPMIYTENPNVWDVRNGPDYGSLDLWGAVIDRTWRECWQDEHVTGTFLWEWQDRAVADKSSTKYYTFYPETGINLLKVKGVVDGFRNPRPEYYHIKMAQSPIALGSKVEVNGDSVVVEATNRYSFTDLNVLHANWRLSKSARNVKEGTATLSLPARASGPLRLSLPAEALAAADTLRLDFDHPGGWNVATYQFELKAVAHPAPLVKSAGQVMFPQFNLVTGKIVNDTKGWRRLDRATAELANVMVRKKGESDKPADAAALAVLPLAEVVAVEAEVVLPKAKNTAGHLHAEFANGKMNYTLTWSGAKAEAYEVGWIFHAPNKGVQQFSWDREGVWSYYPPDHIGRPEGQATPDCARAALTKVDQADAFDFNSTKFNCNWASLTDGHGRGLCLTFAPEMRHHVRGGIEADGTCTLIVNRCYSPPRDISTPIVKDLYTELKKGDEVTGSFEISGGM